MFGGQAAVDQHRGNPRVQVHGPGFSKILIGDDLVDRWEDYLDLLVESVATNGGRGCINASGIWASRHTQEIANAIARRLAAIQPLPPDHADAAQPGVTDATARYREGGAHVQSGHADYLLPTVLHCDSPESPAAHKEYMFPFVSVVRCDEAKMVEAIGPTLVCTVLSGNSALRRRLLDAVHVDRLNFGPVATTALNWLQPHEGNIVEFLYRPRAFQQAALAV
jgi:acyl-CoA reductase-like NAD-dependent aldehyde dehydrogenase